jgi:DNA-binding LacI/PurR family transcriptional regulator
MPTAEIGRVAAEAVLGMIDGASRSAVTISLQPRLVVRGSTAPPRR